MAKKRAPQKRGTKRRAKVHDELPIAHWSHSSLMSFLANPLAWYKRYVEKIYDTPSSPASIVGRAGHIALQHFYGGLGKDAAIDLGLEYLRDIPDFEVNFGKAYSRRAQKQKRVRMEEEYLRAIGFYLKRAPRHDVLGVEVSAKAHVEGLALPIKAVSDLVVASPVQKGAVDIIDHKFVASFSAYGAGKTLFIIQALFNYYTVRQEFGRPVRRFVFQECKKTRNKDGKSQMRRYVIDFNECTDEFDVFHRLINDATDDLRARRVFLPNPQDMFEGENSFDIYRLGLLEE